jgi:SM-20-related protein
MLDYARFAATPLAHDPYDHLVLPGFLRESHARAVAASFPGPDLPGVLPAPAEADDTPFGHLLAELRASPLSQLFAAKFGLSLSPATLMITLRARTRPQDGKIHTDSALKVVTALIYLNDGWASAGGRLRVLRGPDDIEDMAAEVPPLAGTLIAFRRTDRSWHGHKPFDGPRKAIMLNWMVDAISVRRELLRHGLSAGVKSLFSV